MPKRLSLLLCLSLSCASTWADTFSTDFCDFTVSFPGQYSTRELLSEESAGIAAVANATLDTRIAAECWPYAEQLPLDVYAKGMQAEMKQRGLLINNVSIDRNSGVAPQVIISGRLNAGGETYYTTSISFMGRRSRLDLSIVERHPASKAHMAFRDSVKRKQVMEWQARMSPAPCQLVPDHLYAGHAHGVGYLEEGAEVAHHPRQHGYFRIQGYVQGYRLRVFSAGSLSLAALVAGIRLLVPHQ